MDLKRRYGPCDSRCRTIGKGMLCAVMGCMAFSCGSATSPPPETAVAKGPKEVLIATRDTDFKKQIVSRFQNDYGGRARLTVIDLAELDEHPTSDYDALVVMGARMGWLMYSVKERRFLRGLDEPEKVILLMTAADADWKWERPDVDVITGASKPESLDPIYREMAHRLDVILER